MLQFLKKTQCCKYQKQKRPIVRNRTTKYNSMHTTTKNTIDIIESSLTNALTYEAFKTKVEALVAEGKSTGDKPDDEALANYSKLTFTRIKRLDKTLSIDEEIANKIKAIDTPTTWLVLTESWCGDAGQTIPVMQKIAALNPNIELKLLLRDDNEELMNAFLTNGGKAIPKLIAYNQAAKTVTGTWGPRPSEATKLVENYKKEHGKLTPEFKKDLQVWYNKDKGKNTAEDLLQLLSK